MSFNDSTCDFCGVEYDDMGNDLKQRIGDKMWCGGCKTASLSMLEKSETQRKAEAYDALANVVKNASNRYWNARPEYKEWDRHFSFLDVEDGAWRIKSQFGLE